jgi:hypothetical protein
VTTSARPALVARWAPAPWTGLPAAVGPRTEEPPCGRSGSAAWHPLGMLRKAEHARFQAVRVGGIVRKKMKTYFFPNKGNSRGRAVSERELRRIRHTQRSEPVRVWSSGSRTYWMFRDHFYSESDNLSAGDIKALLLDESGRCSVAVSKRGPYSPRRLTIRKAVQPFRTTSKSLCGEGMAVVAYGAGPRSG